MQLAGDPPPFRFLRLEQPAGQRPQLALALPHDLLRPLPLGDVDDRRQDERPLGGPDRVQPDLHRELGPVLAPPEQLPARAHRAARRRVEELVAQGGVSVSRRWRHQDLHRLAEQLVRLVTEEGLRLVVGQGDPAVPSHHDHPVGGGRDHLPESRFRATPVRPFDQQADDQEGLGGAKDDGPDDPPPVEVPEARRPVQDDAAVRQATLGDAPPPQLTPVEHVGVCGRSGGGDAFRASRPPGSGPRPAPRSRPRPRS